MVDRVRARRGSRRRVRTRTYAAVATGLALLAATGCRPAPKAGDFDGDGKADIVFMGTGIPTGNRWTRYVVGQSPADIVAPADGASWYAVPGTYDGQPGLDPAWVTSAGDWVSKGAGPPISFPRPVPEYVQGTSVRYSKMPVPGYYDGGTISVPAWYDEYTGTWAIQGHDPEVFGSGPSNPDGQTSCTSGAWDHDAPMPADYDGDKKTDLAVYNPLSGVWRIRNSFDGTERTLTLGGAGWFPAPADYDGDGHVDPAVVDVIGPGKGTWLIDGQPSRTLAGALEAEILVPAPADYLDDVAVELAAFDLNTSRVWVEVGTSYRLMGSNNGGGYAWLATAPLGLQYALLRSVFIARTCA